MSIRAEYLSTYAKKNGGYCRRLMRFLIGHSVITRHIKIKAALGAFTSMSNVRVITGLFL
jgi:hypothetical protein